MFFTKMYAHCQEFPIPNMPNTHTHIASPSNNASDHHHSHTNHTQGNYRLPHHPDYHIPFPNHQSL